MDPEPPKGSGSAALAARLQHILNKSLIKENLLVHSVIPRAVDPHSCFADRKTTGYRSGR